MDGWQGWTIPWRIYSVVAGVADSAFLEGSGASATAQSKFRYSKRWIADCWLNVRRCQGDLQPVLALMLRTYLRFSRSRLLRCSGSVSFLLLTSIGTPLSIPGSASMNAHPQDDVSKIIERSVDNFKKDWAAEPRFDCSESDKGKNSTKTYQDIMLYGSQYQKLIAVNGKPLDAHQQAEEEQKFQATVSRRQAEKASERRERIAKYEAERKHATELILELSKAFSFTMTGTDKLGDHEVYVLNAEPRDGYEPSSMGTRALTGMRGKLWIDRSSFQWVKVAVEVFRPVSIGGFIARVEPGTRMELEQQQVSSEIWLPRHLTVRSRSKVMFLFSHQTDEEQTFFDYHPSKNFEPRQEGTKHEARPATRGAESNP